MSLPRYREIDSRRDYGESRLTRLSRFAAGFDLIQIISLAVLIAIGLIFIRSTGIQVGTASAMGFYDKQLQWLTAGGLLWLLTALVNYRTISFRILSVLFYLAMLVLLVAVLLIGVRVNGALSWIDIPGVGARLQPSEFAKLAVILVLSAMFASPLFKVNNLFCLLLAGVVTAVPLGLIILEPDFGSAMIFIPVLAGIVFAAGLKWRYIFALTAVTGLVLGAVVLNEVFEYRPLLKEYQRNRIRVFLDPEIDLMNSGYNQYQARLAVGSGGATGKGIGAGTQNTLGFLPQTVSNNDFIFSVIAEETGFAGCLLLIAAYLGLFYSLLRTAYLTTDPFGRYIAIGVGCMIFTHAFVNIGMSIGLSPVTGVPLPFISYGGSFMLMGLAAFGILQSVYRHRTDDK